jgi:endonuclease/exonuclease/phosphatase (EEP) superfamily protein YafD
VAYLIQALALVSIGATLVSLSRHEAWWIRACDFPRVQIVVVGLVAAILLIVVGDMSATWSRLLLAALIATLVYQAAMILPYTRFWPAEMHDARTPPDERSLRLLVVNVLMTNREDKRLLGLIREHDPDVILAVEIDAWWRDRFATLAAAYPHRFERPLDNTYGMLLYAKLEPVAPEIRFLLKPDIPSIRTGLRLRSGVLVTVYGLHPEPPSPSEADSSLPRDVELIVVGREVAAADAPTIVAGDFNDVAWSHTSRLFRRLSRLLDPRIGRGMFNTFHAERWPVRWPLDHVFVSQEFALHEIRRLPAFGSDHFPILIALRHEPAVAGAQEPPEPDHDDQREADEKLERVGVDPAEAGNR